MALVDLKSNLASFRSTFSTKSVEDQIRTGDTGTKFDPTSAETYSGKTQFKQSFIDQSLFSRADEYILKYNTRTQFSEKKVNTSKFNLDTITPYNTTFTKFTDRKIESSKYNIDTIPTPFSSQTKYTPSTKYPIETQSPFKFNWVGTTPPAVDFFDNNKSNAKGFTTNLGKSGDKEKSQFISFDYTKSVPTANSKFDFGDATLTNQLGTGSPFPQFPGADHLYKWLPVAHTGFHTKNTYSETAGKEGFLKATYTTNSPIDDQYKKFNLRDEAYNPTYMPQPLILRGLQRKGDESPQRWGFGVNFDDGLIRAGAVTTAERLAIDTVRIAKWMASPKGLLWVVKQVGLGLTNPKVEQGPLNPGPLGRQTRIHTGLASLLSVPGTPLGLHFTRHGIPFANEVASYGNVLKAKKEQWDGLPKEANRLVKLTYELSTSPIVRGPDALIGQAFGAGMPIPSLTGLAGPHSVYGIGATTIRRGVQSTLGFENDINPFNWQSPYAGVHHGFQTATEQNAPGDGFKRERNVNPGTSTSADQRPSLLDYAKNLFGNDAVKGQSLSAKDYSANPYIRNFSPEDVIGQELANKKRYSDNLAFGSLRAFTAQTYDANVDETRRTVRQYDEEGLVDGNDQTIGSLRNNIDGNVSGEFTPGARTNQFDTTKNIESSEARSYAYPDTPNGDINQYMTMAYHKIPKDSTTRAELKGDFRNALGDDTKGYTGKPADPDYYKNNNLETRYGFGELGKVGANRTNPGEFIVQAFSGKKADRRTLSIHPDFRGDKITALDVTNEQVIRSEVYPDGASDFIKFYFEDGNQGTNVMPFRCTMTGFSDSFSPGWDSVSIMGRPDGAYLYSSFERSISFTFMVAALSRSEMLPMWRKLNKLASYTMPDFYSGGRASGPMMRISIGNLFQQTPGFITSLSYTIPDDTSWDIADDASVENPTPKQLPTVIEVSVSFTIVGDFRPQKDGRVYSLQRLGGGTNKTGDWLMDARKTVSKEPAEVDNAPGTTTNSDAGTTNTGESTPTNGNNAPATT